MTVKKSKAGAGNCSGSFVRRITGALEIQGGFYQSLAETVTRTAHRHSRKPQASLHV